MPSIPLLTSSVAFPLGALLLGIGQAGATEVAFRGQGSRGQAAVTRERLLVIHDPARGVEHLFQDLALEGSAGSVAFVVPVPGKPEVTKVQSSPFEKLAAEVPLPRFTVEQAEAYRKEVAARPKLRVGTIESEVLAADDGEGLERLLAERKLVSRPATDRWLATYRGRGFYFVVLRYTPPRGKGPVATPVIRVTFPSPVAYLPYSEGGREEAGEGVSVRREARLWVAAPRALLPLAVQEAEGEVRWVRPLSGGDLYLESPDAAATLRPLLGPDASLLPDGDLWARHYLDVKGSRAGFGDVLFALMDPSPGSVPDSAALERLLPVLDPKLVAGGTP